jgi:hypothetical protein
MRRCPKAIVCAGSLHDLDVSNCEKPTGISRDRTKRNSLKPTEAHKSPQKTNLQGSVFPQKPRRRKMNPS